MGRFYCHRPERNRTEQRHRLETAVARGLSLQSICRHPVTLRMLFDLYAPEEVHALEINVFGLYCQFWEQRVVNDSRAGGLEPRATGAPDDASDVAESIALIMLSQGRPELPEPLLLARLTALPVAADIVQTLTGREVLQRTTASGLRFFHQTFFEHAAARGLLSLWGRDAFDKTHVYAFGDEPEPFAMPVCEQLALLGAER